MIDLPDSHAQHDRADPNLPGLPWGGARCAFGLCPEFSPVRFRVETALGDCSLAPHHNPTLSGTLLEYLRPGALPVALGQDGGGDCSCDPRLAGVVRERLDGDSAPFTIALRSFALSPHSRPFGIGATGEFLAHAHWEITSGSLELELPGWGARSLDLRGRTSPEYSGLGRIRFDANGVHLARNLDLRFNLREPASGMYVVLLVHGLLSGDMQYPGDWPRRSRPERDLPH
jgi:hypothetical protein